jgi:protein required for attachment to host cells
MQVPHNTYVLVADGRKLLFLRNDGDAQALNLKVELAEEHPNPADRFQKTDAAGGAMGTQMGASAPAAAQTGGMTAHGSGTGGGGQGGAFAPSRGTFEETDFHQLEEDRFAAEAADMLRKRALARKFDKLIIVAPPRTLGELRKHYHKEVEARLTGELAKDLTGHPIPDIEAALLAAD